MVMVPSLSKHVTKWQWYSIYFKYGKKWQEFKYPSEWTVTPCLIIYIWYKMVIVRKTEKVQCIVWSFITFLVWIGHGTWLGEVIKLVSYEKSLVIMVTGAFTPISRLLQVISRRVRGWVCCCNYISSISTISLFISYYPDLTTIQC